MKKLKMIIVLVILIVLLFLVFFYLNKNNKRQYEDLFNEKYEHYGELVGEYYSALNYMYGIPVYSSGALLVYEDNGLYIVVCVDYDTIKSIGVLSKKGKWLYTKNLKLINFNDSINYIGWKLSEVEEMYGEYHVSLNSGDICDAYLTKDVKMYCFYSRARVYDLAKRDLLSEIEEFKNHNK